MGETALTASAPLRVLVVDDEPNVRRTLTISLESDGHTVMAVSNVTDAAAEATRGSFDLVFLDVRLGTASGLDLLPKLLVLSAFTQVVVITGHGTIELAVTAIKAGAADLLTKPFTPAQVRAVVEKTISKRSLQQKLAGLEQQLKDRDSQPLLQSQSPNMRQAVELARQVAGSESTVLLRGESGTGKGVLAQAIHSLSGRRSGPFVTVNCPSISATLLESELFGHARGSFTGANRDYAGRVTIANGGTLFLDEIGDIPLEIQPKLLRFIQDREYERVGESATRKADVRLICATNANLEKAIADRRFREDLYYRINVFPIDLPPLRQRTGDIVPLAREILAGLRGARHVLGFTEPAERLLTRLTWPGNVRELRNVVERAVILCRSDQIGPELLPHSETDPGTAEVALGDPVPFEKIEEAHIRRVLARTASLEEAAQALDVDVATLWRKRRKYGI